MVVEDECGRPGVVKGESWEAGGVVDCSAVQYMYSNVSGTLWSTVEREVRVFKRRMRVGAVVWCKQVFGMIRCLDLFGGSASE